MKGVKVTHYRQRSKGRRFERKVASERRPVTVDEEPSTGSEAASENIYGLIPVLEALRAGHRAIDSISIAEGAKESRLRELLALARNAKVPIHRVPRINLDRSLKDVSHQGVVAKTAAARYRDADDLLELMASKVGTESPPLAVALDGIEDPRNLGAILRTAECAGVDGVFVPERRAVGLTGLVAKASAGALEHVAVARVTNFARLIEQLKERNIWTVGAAPEGRSEYTEWDWTLPTTIFLGSEGAGLHRLVKERCDTLVRIPVHGHLESINVSVAAGILLYEALRRRADLTSTS